MEKRLKILNWQRGFTSKKKNLHWENMQKIQTIQKSKMFNIHRMFIQP